MADLIQQASSGRSKCRGCGRSIATGELRFGESLPNAYGEGEALYWFHLLCAACMRPEKFLPVLEALPDEVPERAWLQDAATFGLTHRRLPRLLRAERAASGRAHCRACHESIDKGSWRLSLQMFEEGRFSPIGTIHVDCAAAYFGTTELAPRLRRLAPELEPNDLLEIETLLRAPRPQPSVEEEAQVEAVEAGVAPKTEGPSESLAAPGLAKTVTAEKPTGRRARR